MQALWCMRSAIMCLHWRIQVFTQHLINSMSGGIDLHGLHVLKAMQAGINLQWCLLAFVDNFLFLAVFNTCAAFDVHCHFCYAPKKRVWGSLSILPLQLQNSIHLSIYFFIWSKKNPTQMSFTWFTDDPCILSMCAGMDPPAIESTGVQAWFVSTAQQVVHPDWTISSAKWGFWSIPSPPYERPYETPSCSTNGILKA